MAEFKVKIKCMWNSETTEFQGLAGEEEPELDDHDDDEEDEDAE